MTFSEKKLYHQIHPLKLSLDIVSGILTTYLLWEHDIIFFLILFLLPSVLASLFIIRYADLESLKNSRFGHYIRKYMTIVIETFRVAGQFIMWISGWYHFPIGIVIGFLVVIGAWSNGFLFSKN